jgi:hypothetical protein
MRIDRSVMAIGICIFLGARLQPLLDGQICFVFCFFKYFLRGFFFVLYFVWGGHGVGGGGSKA